jgi:SAM-dependent methyltransferase
MNARESRVGRPGATAAYDPAAVDYRTASDRFWSTHSFRTVERMKLVPGGSVLDVASGPGISTVAAAIRVGPTGRVVALDSSEQMLRMAGERAQTYGMDNVELHAGDMARLDFPAGSFDAVLSVQGIFFVPDMPALVAALWKLVRPGGQLAITTFGANALEPAISLWRSAVKAERPEAALTFPWERTDDPEDVRSLLATAGVPGARIEVEPHEIAITTPDDWWIAVRGSAMRRTMLDLDDRAAERVRERFDRALRERGVWRVELPAIYALARKS